MPAELHGGEDQQPIANDQAPANRLLIGNARTRADDLAPTPQVG